MITFLKQLFCRHRVVTISEDGKIGYSVVWCNRCNKELTFNHIAGRWQ